MDENSIFHRHEISEYPGKQWRLNIQTTVVTHIPNRDFVFAEVGDICRFWCRGHLDPKAGPQEPCRNRWFIHEQMATKP